MQSPPSRTQIAQRIRQDLLREIDHDIEVDRLLLDARYARDVLLVCDALLGCDLPALATMFREADTSSGADATAARSRPGRAAQANDWERDTSGFGLTHPPPLAPEPAQERRRDAPARWPRS